MEVDDYAVEQVLADGRRCLVPIYQRKYEWKDAQLDRFWEDVETKAIEVLEGESRFQHYMGALILLPSGSRPRFGVTPSVQVVDGQQRLTTFQLFLAALREVAKMHTCEEIAVGVHDYLFNKLKAKDDTLARYKLMPTPSDEKVFYDILEGEYDTIRASYKDFYHGNRVPKSTPLRALRAYYKFYRLLDDFARFGQAERDEVGYADDTPVIGDETDTRDAAHRRLEAMLHALLGRMKLVVIMLGDDDDAQAIFETLNSAGASLLAMDLVRNNVFYRAEKEGAAVKELYESLWDPFDDKWWRERAPLARPARPRIDHFLAHVLVAETGQRISMRELYAEYRAFAVPKGRPRFERVEDELRLLREYSPIYEVLEGRVGSEAGEVEGRNLRWIGRKLAAWQVTTAFPVVMQTSRGELPAEEKRAIYRLVYSYVVRRALSGLSAKNLNKVFHGLSQAFVADGASREVLEVYFAQLSGDSTRFPNDREFRQGLLREPAYRRAVGTRIQDVLWELERAGRPEFWEKIAKPKKLWVEHVLPQSWTEAWPFDEGEFVDRQSDDSRAEERNRILHTLGNLTLTTAGLDIALGNRGFLEKREMLAKHTGLHLNTWFLEKDRWAEAEIRQRGEALADRAMTIWPSLERMRDGE